ISTSVLANTAEIKAHFDSLRSQFDKATNSKLEDLKAGRTWLCKGFRDSHGRLSSAEFELKFKESDGNLIENTEYKNTFVRKLAFDAKSGWGGSAPTDGTFNDVKVTFRVKDSRNLVFESTHKTDQKE